MDQVTCVASEGDAPPEDVGSIPGFDRFLRIIGDTSGPEHDDMAA